MSHQSLITADLVVLDANLGATKAEVIHALAALVAKAGRAEAAGLAADALAREEKMSTGLGGGIAIPHCRSAAVTTNSLAFARLSPPVDFGAADGPADVAFLIAASDGSDDAHLQLLAKLARSLMRSEFTDGLRAATSPEQIVALVEQATADEPVATPDVVTAPAAASAATPPVLVAVTACPTGIAHTFMAADGLEQAGRAAEVEIHVEPQGSGRIDWLAPEVIARADAVIFATDLPVRDRERFAGLPVVEASVKRAINEPAKLIAEALVAAENPKAARVGGSTDRAGATSSASASTQLGWGRRIQQALMTGVSYMIPFVAAGGLLIALGFLFGGFDIALPPGAASARTCADLTWLDAASCQAAADGGKSIGSLVLADSSLTNMPAGFIMTLGAVMFAIGAAAFGFLVPALSGYIAYALAGRPGIAPGFVGGAISVTLGAGFLGGLVTGLVAGLIAAWITSFKAPRWLAGLMPVVIIPLVATLLTGGLMYFLLGQPLASLTKSMQAGLGGMSGGSAIALGIVLGLMMCFDLGGPVNKAAYLFATAGLSAGTAANFQVMAVVMAAGMVPPLAMALATVVRKKLFSEVERENGTAAWLLGASFISEGAIPFAAADPLRVIPSMMAGGAVTGALSMALGVGLRAPHGGIFVLFAFQPLPAAIFGFLISLVAGVLVSAALVVALKTWWPAKQVEAVA
ncbi:MAG: PTS lactose transporter subunit IIC [Actinobacteria bacterium HGW-Actinobacteria-2]|nr:MAG: PTS lactose transporter subunit IIC [Actinobacteria bacterium HGW-Actinobacteria-2]